MIQVRVRGIPAPQGSRVSFRSKKGKIGTFESSPQGRRMEGERCDDHRDHDEGDRTSRLARATAHPLRD